MFLKCRWQFDSKVVIVMTVEVFCEDKANIPPLKAVFRAKASDVSTELCFSIKFLALKQGSKTHVKWFLRAKYKYW